MSLKGLDAAPVHEAYSQCQHEAGGWFLLKYISRDEVELFRRGKNGVHEARTAIASYPDPSPLYGLIIYRRRKVLIKFIPEGTSRLLQARTAVHFQDVLERYSPYETLLEITTADALNDTSLAASFPLHTGSSSALSNKLQEISEDAEDGGPQPERSSSVASSATGSMFGTQRYKMEKRVDQIMSSDRPDRQRYVPSMYASKDRLSGAPSSPTLSGTPNSQKTSVSQFLVREDAGRRSVTSLPANSPRPSNSSPRMSPRTSPLLPAKSTPDPAQPISPIQSLHQSRSPDLPVAQTKPEPLAVVDQAPNDEKKEPAPLQKSQSPVLPPPIVSDEAANTEEKEPPQESTEEQSHETPVSEKPKVEDDPYDFSHLFKPKVKLGPRVVTSPKRSAGPGVSSVPAPFRTSGKKQDMVKDETPTTPVDFSRGLGLQPPPIPHMPEYKPRPVSRGSVKSIPSQRSTASSADKTRLMRALELRKKKMQKVNSQQKISEPVQEEDTSAPELPPTIKEVPTPPLVEKTPQLDLKIEDFGPLATKADSGISLESTHDEIKHHEARPADNVKVDSAIPEEPKEVSPKPTIEESKEENPDLSRNSMELPKTAEVEAAPSMAASIAASSDVMPAVSPPPPPKPVIAVDTNLSKVDRKPVQSEAKETVEEKPTEIDRSSNKAPERSLDDSSDDDEDYTTPQSETKDPIDKAEIIASLQKAASPNTTDTTVSPHVPSVSSPRADKDIPQPPRDSREFEGEPTMSPRMLEEITLGFLVPDDGTYEDYTRSSDMDGLGIKAPTLTIPTINTDRDEIREVSEPQSRRESAAASPLVNEGDITTDEDDDDDDILEELHSATVEQATPISMARSPLEQALRKESVASQGSAHSIRSVNIRRVSSLQQDRASNNSTPTSPGDAPVNFRSASYSRNLTPPSVEVYEPSGPGGLRRNVSVGIVKRYESLAEATTKGVTPFYQSSDTRPLSPNAYDEFKQEDAVYQRAPSRGPDEGSPPASIKYPSSNALGLDKQAVAGAQHNHHGRVESMSISARIVKPDGASTEDGALQTSELVMNYKPLPSPPAPLPSPKPESMPSPTQASSPTMAAHGRNSASIDSGHKEGNMASRFFKRMSNLSNRRRSAASTPSVPQAETSDSVSIASRPATRGEVETPPAVVVGDLNIQFPDSLLWKRRIVDIDEAGFVCFSNPSASEGQRNDTAKKCHLREFRIPYTPDLERQELPFSIIMDFVDGSTPIQAACEDSLTHRQVLFILRTHWKAYAAM